MQSHTNHKWQRWGQDLHVPGFQASSPLGASVSPLSSGRTLTQRRSLSAEFHGERGTSLTISGGGQTGGCSPSHPSWPTLVPLDWPRPRPKEKPRTSEDGSQTAMEVGAEPEVSRMAPGASGLRRPPRVRPELVWTQQPPGTKAEASKWTNGCHVLSTIQAGPIVFYSHHLVTCESPQQYLELCKSRDHVLLPLYS